MGAGGWDGGVGVAWDTSRKSAFWADPSRKSAFCARLLTQKRILTSVAHAKAHSAPGYSRKMLPNVLHNRR